MQKNRISTKKILSEDEIRNTLFDLIGDELELIYEEPPIENIFIELAFWRASYKIKAKNTSAKATKMARKSNSVKQERISQAILEIEKAFDECIRLGKRPSLKALQAQLRDLERPDIYSEEDGSTAMVKPGTVKTWLTKKNQQKKKSASSQTDK